MSNHFIFFHPGEQGRAEQGEDITGVVEWLLCWTRQISKGNTPRHVNIFVTPEVHVKLRICVTNKITGLVSPICIFTNQMYKVTGINAFIYSQNK